jgi:hypothetical protein
MSWAKGHSSLTENPFNKPILDRCINCGDIEAVQSAVSVIQFIVDQGSRIKKHPQSKKPLLGNRWLF